ncbi:MAG: biotin synthase BioB [Hydrogenophilales bacterium CG_4_9_14_3_um_filter_59_35]|nr:MAG: biotin synthase BioB [Hydrogenophilales bacterium CG18_big_fil_WC_8_21_14_2_50_58_12]PIY01307.1 MAG: biotin synthase BioB [Hydrogenophilales bacterium CG_4_10_14_3_um_filter_58_23]PJB06049.1 MAG: biotin synthase BioB [Hydrogenophilales bacterium CG_4_9_14_3_um_filter_59_35]
MNDLLNPAQGVAEKIAGECRRWSVAQAEALFALPFSDLMFQAQAAHRAHFDPNEVQVSTLLSIKTGGCSEDCGYCSQSKRHDTGLEQEDLLALETVLDKARAAKAKGATRFCMGAAWRGPKQKDLKPVLEMITAVRELGLETCVTLGMLKEGQAEQLREAGLDYYNHNLDTAPEYYGEVVTTHTYQDRLDTLDQVRQAGMKVCSGGIVGMGESRTHRAALLTQLANLNPPPESVPINLLVQVKGTPLDGAEALDPIEFARTVAVARLLMPQSLVRLSAGREQMDEPLQALCFLAGANSIFYGEKLLTTPNPSAESDLDLFGKLGIRVMGG